MKYAIAAIGAAALAAAQSGSSDSPYIPDSGISPGCSSFLQNLDSNAELASCSSSLLSATSLFDPTSASSSSTTEAQVSQTLRQLCSSGTSCTPALIKQSLTWFSGNCSAELSANNAVVKSNYDVLYTLKPFTDAVCTRAGGNTGAYCATQIGESSTPSLNGTTGAPGATASAQGSTGSFVNQIPQLSLSNLYINISQAAANAARKLRKRQQTSNGSSSGTTPANSTSSSTTTSTSQAASGPALLPNATTFRSTNLPFLFLSGDMGSSALCVPCTKSILAAYVSWETDFPYATGLASSPLLGGQAGLWTEIGNVCGSGFLSAITQQAGNNYSSGAGKTAAASLAAVAAAALAVLAL